MIDSFIGTTFFKCKKTLIEKYTIKASVTI